MSHSADRGLAIAAHNLTKGFEGGMVRALDGIDLEVAPGEQIAITGPTGCGKSTLLSLLALLERPDAGELHLGGESAASIRPAERWRSRHLGIIFQFHHLLPHLTAAENVMLPLVGTGAKRGEIKDRARRVLTAVGLGHRAEFLVTKLSGGERQLAAVARALVHAPPLVLADEPTGSVDSRTGDRILRLLISGELTEGATIVLVTHDPRVAAAAGRTVPMLDGRIAQGAVGTGESSGRPATV